MVQNQKKKSDFKWNTSIIKCKSHKKKEGVKISKTDYAVFVHFQVEQIYLKIRSIGQREEMSCLISFGMRQFGIHLFTQKIVGNIYAELLFLPY
jgi:hypothetical protein